jgi:hypothetical protein
MFDIAKKLTAEQIEMIVQSARIPRFTDHDIHIQADRNILTFVVDRKITGIQKDWLMVESGMQQQGGRVLLSGLPLSQWRELDLCGQHHAHGAGWTGDEVLERPAEAALDV